MQNETLTITEVEILFLPQFRNGHIGWCSFLVNGSFKVNAVAIHTRLNKPGIRLVFADTSLFGKRTQTCFPISQEANQLLEEAVSRKLQELMSKSAGNVQEIENGNSSER